MTPKDVKEMFSRLIRMESRICQIMIKLGINPNETAPTKPTQSKENSK
jgi:hypothetical protein